MDQANNIAYIILTMMILIVVFLVFNVIRENKHYYKCLKCQRYFKIGFFQTLLGSMIQVQTSKHRLVTCPFCGNTKMVKKIKDEN